MTDTHIELPPEIPGPQVLAPMVGHPTPISPKAKVMRRIIQSLDKNQYGLPACFYRADLIPVPIEAANPLTGATEVAFDISADFREQVRLATVDLDYSQGFPALPDGEPFWSLLPCEPAEAHRAFIHYLDMPRTKHPNETTTNSVRQIHALKAATGLPTHELLTMSYLYFWPQRALAYDLFIAAAHNKKREYMLQDVENEHLRLSATYLKYAEEFLTQVFNDPEAHGLTPKDAITLMSKMIQVQRMSLGVSPNGQTSGKDSDGAPSNAPFEMILRTLVEKAGIVTAGGNTGDSTQDAAKLLYENPKDLATAQELIIRMGNAKNPRVSTAPLGTNDVVAHEPRPQRG